MIEILNWGPAWLALAILVGCGWVGYYLRAWERQMAEERARRAHAYERASALSFNENAPRVAVPTRRRSTHQEVPR